MEIDFSMYNILIVEDSELNLFVLKEILEREHFNVFTASGAKGAFENLQQQRIDLILMDVMMGNTNGFDLTKELKSMELYKHIPVLFITNLKSPDDVVRGFDSGGVDYIPKPFNKKELLQRIKHQIKLIESGHTIAMQTAQLQEAILNRDSMYAILAHDLRSPISSLKMILNILTMSAEERNTGYGNMVNTGNDIAEQLFSVLDNLLKWTKNSLGVLSYMPQEIEIDEMIKGVVETLQPTAKLKNIEIKLTLQPGLQIFFDADIMKSILRNLLINAVKFSHENSLIKLNLSRDGDDAMVEFIDTGVGMSVDAQRQLLDQMKEEGKITPMREKGKGLGLWIVYHFIQRGGGTFFFESEENRGSRFGFCVPLEHTIDNH
ncbi:MULTISPECIES: hybrid sensor histidine kinase/response regulator [Sphingobacterium]|uniref:hybrid sensor histidine kinase/response regulator n=2 Tax=Sphingobacterium TaxID=28453 RepID=UPI000E9F4C1A|nr:MULTISPECIES: hybrid sensor histidine kinase/response regulator [Sphingobacterium]HAU52748.1 hybrid sensor histidine kinase/response regulator [Sphingobacterium sp.]